MEKKEKQEAQEIVVTESNAAAKTIEYAIRSNAPVDQLEKLLMLQERHDANQARKAYHVAMAAFKANPPKINKDRKVKIPHKNGSGKTEYNHASLYNITEKISAELSKYGLSASWNTKQNGAVSVTCKITHEKGHSEETTLTAPTDTTGSKNAIQAIGSTITYLQRYTLLALTGLATFDDDDGKATDVAEEVITDDQLHQIADLIADKNVDIARFCKAFGIDDIPMMPKKRYAEAMLRLNAKKVGKTQVKK